MDTRDSLLLFGPLLIAAALLASGCTPESARWTPAESPKENKIEFVTVTHEVHFEPGKAAMVAGDGKALEAFLGSVQLSYGDQVTIDAGPRHGDPAHDALAAKRLAEVTGLLRRLRVMATLASRPTVEGALARDGVVVSVGRYVVTAPQCPDWSKPEGDDFTNTPPSNYGCATASNLGLMVANPADLVRGTPGGPADADFVARGIQRYRSGEISKSLKPELPKNYSGGSGGGGGGN
jgi:pilus assembly protein CpaD